MFRRLVSSCTVVALVLTGAAAAQVIGAGPASASCTSNPIEGNWRNINTATSGMTGVLIETCQPIVTCSGDVCSIQHGAGTFMTPFGKCHPTDCNWGRRQAQSMGGGWIRTTIDFGFKRADVWAKTYDYYGRTYLRLWVNHDFTAADGRADYVTDDWMLK
jgi:hypothetical protein